MADTKNSCDQFAHDFTKVAVANAAMPSSRPVKPRRSEVVALIEIRSSVRSIMSPIRAVIAAAWGPIFGCSQIKVQSMFVIMNPISAAREDATLDSPRYLKKTGESADDS